MIYIQPDPLKPDAIRVIFDSEIIFGKWLLVIRENSKNDRELEEYRKNESFQVSNIFEILKNAQAVDICFLIDCTGSMDKYIDEVKTVINRGLEKLRGVFKNIDLIEECKQLIEVAKAKGLHESEILAKENNKDTAVNNEFRKSKQAWINDNHHPIIMKIANFSEKITGMPRENQEELQVATYEPNGKFVEHFDSVSMKIENIVIELIITLVKEELLY